MEYTNDFMVSNITFVGKKDELKIIHTAFNELKAFRCKQTIFIYKGIIMDCKR